MNIGDICLFISIDRGYFSKYLKGYGMLKTPLPEPHYTCTCIILLKLGVAQAEITVTYIGNTKQIELKDT